MDEFCDSPSYLEQKSLMGYTPRTKSAWLAKHVTGLPDPFGGSISLAAGFQSRVAGLQGRFSGLITMQHGYEGLLQGFEAGL
jgi:hypothetical protein